MRGWRQTLTPFPYHPKYAFSQPHGRIHPTRRLYESSASNLEPGFSKGAVPAAHTRQDDLKGVVIYLKDSNISLALTLVCVGRCSNFYAITCVRMESVSQSKVWFPIVK